MFCPTKIINLSLQRKVYNLSFEKEFSDVEETGILINPEIKDEYFSKLSKKRIK